MVFIGTTPLCLLSWSDWGGNKKKEDSEWKDGREREGEQEPSQTRRDFGGLGSVRWLLTKPGRSRKYHSQPTKP